MQQSLHNHNNYGGKSIWKRDCCWDQSASIRVQLLIVEVNLCKRTYEPGNGPRIFSIMARCSLQINEYHNGDDDGDSDHINIEDITF